MRRILYYSLLCLLWVSVNSCKDDEAAQPPTPTFTVDKTSGLYNSTEFTFVVDQVDGNAVSLLPYGTEHPSLGGILIPSASFTNGKATVKFTYARVGTFNAVAVSNNHTSDGESIKNSVSSPTAITITSNETDISDFSFDGSTKTTIDKDAHTIAVVMPYSKSTVINALKARFSKSTYATVAVGGTNQQSDTTVNNFTSPVTYTVTSQDKAVSTNWTVTVSVTPADTNNTFKSLSAIVANKSIVGGTYKKETGKVLPAYIDNVGRTVVVYDTLGVDYTKYDSLSLDYALNGAFNYVKYDAKNHVKGKDTVSLKTPLDLIVVPEDSVVTGPATYKVYMREAPRLHVSFPALIPAREGTSSDFTVKMDVLNGTDIHHVATNLTFDPPAGATLGAITVGTTPYVPGLVVDYSGDVKVNVTVTQDGVTYVVTFTVSVAVLKP